MARRAARAAVMVAMVVLAAGCRRHRHHADAGAAVQGPMAAPGATPLPGAMNGTPPPSAQQGIGLMVPPPVQTAPDNPTQPVPPPGVMRVLPNVP